MAEEQQRAKSRPMMARRLLPQTGNKHLTRAKLFDLVHAFAPDAANAEGEAVEAATPTVVLADEPQ